MTISRRNLFGLLAAVPLARMAVGAPAAPNRLVNLSAPPPTTLVTYQWWRDGRRIAGATGDSYPLTADDVGARIRLETIPWES